MTTLHDRLGDLADEVAVTAVPTERLDLWAAGRRHHRRHRAGAALLGLAAVVLVVGLGIVVGLPSRIHRSAPPADVPFGQLHLPTTVYSPGRWAPGTDENGPLGQLAAVAAGERAVPDGPARGSNVDVPFGVSAVDGSVRWLDLPWGASGFDGQLTLSPDGTKVAVGVEDGAAQRGWAVYDTTTGNTLQLRDPAQPKIVGADQIQFQFTGDSRYLETIYSPTGSDRSRDQALIVWDVQTGERIVAERSGRRLGILGSAPTGIVWSRKADIFTFDPATGKTTTRTAASDRLMEWSDGPGGLSAYIARGERDEDPWRLFSGDGVQLGRDRKPVYDSALDDIVGWRDGTTVVVVNWAANTVRYVDVTSGRTLESQKLEAADHDGSRVMTLPVFAADLWANSLVSGVRPPEYDDPRVRLLRIVGPALVLGLAGWGLWRRRVRP